MQLDPEDLYLAVSFGDRLKVVKDIRTNDKLTGWSARPGGTAQPHGKTCAICSCASLIMSLLYIFVIVSQILTSHNYQLELAEKYYSEA
jgi:hypothetical protein